MKPFLIYGVAALALAGCAEREDPSAVAAAQAADAAADRVAADSAAEQAAATLAKANDSAMTWSTKDVAGSGTALYGTAEGAPAFMAQCDATRREIVFTRNAAVSAGPIDMKVGTGAQIKVVQAEAKAEPLPQVSGRLTASDPVVAAIAASDEAMSVQIGDGETLLMPPGAPMRQVIADCG